MKGLIFLSVIQNVPQGKLVFKNHYGTTKIYLQRQIKQLNYTYNEVFQAVGIQEQSYQPEFLSSSLKPFW